MAPARTPTRPERNFLTNSRTNQTTTKTQTTTTGESSFNGLFVGLVNFSNNDLGHQQLWLNLSCLGYQRSVVGVPLILRILYAQDTSYLGYFILGIPYTLNTLYLGYLILWILGIFYTSDIIYLGCLLIRILATFITFTKVLYAQNP